MPLGGEIQVSAHGSSITSQNGMALTPGDYLHIIFRDSGRGIPDENLAKVFDPYFSSKDMGNTKGQGLGLAVCHAIIRKHGGFISVESSQGDGAAFHIWLPAATADNSSTGD
jgi:signal transduction histidine kinase